MTVSAAITHLLLRLQPLNRALRAAVAHQSQVAAQLFHPDVTPLCVTEEQVQIFLEGVEQLSIAPAGQLKRAILTDKEAANEEQLRQSCLASGIKLPLDRLTEALELSDFELEAILLCAAVEIDRSYERIYAYILDDLNRRYPCVELLSSLTANSLAETCERQSALGPYGKLRRTGILNAYGEAATNLRQELRLAPALFAFLIGTVSDVTSWFHDRAAIALPARLEDLHLPNDIERKMVERLGTSLREGDVTAVGIWGARQSALRETAMAVAVAASLPLRQLLLSETSQNNAVYEQRIAETIQTAVALGEVVWIETDVLTSNGHENLSGVNDFLANALAVAHVRIILTGTRPWRPVALLKSRPYAQIEIASPDFKARQTMWENAFPQIGKDQRDDLAARFRMNAEELSAVARMAGTQALIATNGAAQITDRLEEACDAVTRKQTYHFATVIKPRRGPSDLILPEELHKQVIEIARFHRHWPRIADTWGFGRMITGEGGIKVLFTGVSGTGKTLAAEVIAFELGMAMLKVDLSRVVSKWVGETERNLERAFSEAEDSNAVLFFDEADSLFGKRGEVRHGVDRYSNLEVSYLLQRLETYYGLVILASNLRDNIDNAFIRRFQVVLNFPRPELSERRRLWSIAFPKSAPLQDDIDFELIAKLEMTGASIVNAAQTAALLAMESAKNANGRDTPASIRIEPVHVVQAIARQFQREARLLTASELGAYASLVQEAR